MHLQKSKICFERNSEENRVVETQIKHEWVEKEDG